MVVESGSIILKLVLAAVLSGVIGLEREWKRKPAGLRTNILVGVGSALIMIISQQFIADPARIAAGVITGIGFLGAGIIIQSRGHVYGITTAASIWIVAAIGLAVGLGNYFAAFITTLVALVVLYVFASERLVKMANLKKHK